MKKGALFLLYTLLFFGALILFTPKESIYYFAEEQLRPLGVIIANEETLDHALTLEIRDGDLYVQKIKSADIGSATFCLLGLYNTVSVTDVVLDKTFEQLFPPLIRHIDLEQSLLDPLHLNASASGDFGEAEASVNLLERTLTVLVKPSKLMLSRYKNTLGNLQKTKEGDYQYEYKF